jgi:hypothetical protein
MDLLSHCIKEKQKQFGSRAMIGILCILTVFGLLGWVYLSQASYVTMTSRHVQELEAEKMRLQEQNLQLMAEIARQESVARLADRAQGLGFVKVPIDNAEFLVIAEPEDTDILLASTSPTDSWWDKVTEQFAAWSQTGTP